MCLEDLRRHRRPLGCGPLLRALPEPVDAGERDMPDLSGARQRRLRHGDNTTELHADAAATTRSSTCCGGSTACTRRRSSGRGATNCSTAAAESGSPRATCARAAGRTAAGRPPARALARCRRLRVLSLRRRRRTAGAAAPAAGAAGVVRFFPRSPLSRSAFADRPSTPTTLISNHFLSPDGRGPEIVQLCVKLHLARARSPRL